MITISAFADEIGPSLTLQMDTCEANGVRCIDVRRIDDKNVSQMTLEEVKEYKKQMDDRGFSVPCIGSPIGKIKMDDDFQEHLDLLKHCCEVAHAFGTDRLRMFSFYPSQGNEIQQQREAVMDRMAAMVRVGEQMDVVLYHENEKAIYGARPDGVKDLFATIRSENFKGIFDPANYVEEDVKPYDEGWKQGLAELTDFFHIKDKVPGQKACVPAGEGHGQFREIFADLAKTGFDGFMTLEPHLRAAEQFQGFTGPEMFSKAADALKKVLTEAGLEYKTY
jgi:sugar phosphate isomerase/epimerase